MNGFKKLEEALKDLPDDYIIFLETSPENALELSMALVKYLSNRNDKGIIVSANRPYANLVSVYTRNNIDMSKMFILDCISKSQNAAVAANNVEFIDNVSSLTDISLKINERLNGSEGKQFIFFDSVTTMLIHNKPYVFARFVHNVLTKMRLRGVGGILVSLVDNSNREIRAEIAQLCDKVIKI
jgi:hypothetical protein